MKSHDAYPVRDYLKNTTDDPISFNWKKNEELFWSEWIYKINIRRQLQPRRFVLTNRRLINFGDNDLGDKF
jgi:serine/threonine protein kinase